MQLIMYLWISIEALRCLSAPAVLKVTVTQLRTKAVEQKMVSLSQRKESSLFNP
jgi:hypothetical protein